MSLITHINPSLAEPLRLACIGDSITEGTIFSETDRSTLSWPAQLQNMLGPHFTLGNFGRGGATACVDGDTPYVGSPQYTAALAFAPHVVIIMLGTNDARSANVHCRQHFHRDLFHLGQTFSGLPSQPVICLATPIPAFRENHTVSPNVIRDELVPAVERLAAEQSWLLMHMYRHMGHLGPYCADGIHPDHLGNASLAQCVRDFFTNFLEKPDPPLR